MSSYKVSIVIPVWNEWHHTAKCLDTLRPTLGLHDEVIVVDNGSEDRTAAGLKQYPWVKVVSNSVNQGFARGCNQGAAEATGDVIIFLNNDTVLASRWLDDLIAPFSADNVFATGPMSNFVSGPQLVRPVPYSIERMSDYRAFAKDFQTKNKGKVTETVRLVGFALAVRRSAFEAINGFDEGFGIGGCEDDDLCLRLIRAGGRLLMCHGSYVHHVGHATFDGNDVDWFSIQEANSELLQAKHGTNAYAGAAMPAAAPLISACMIMKDEFADISDCLSSLNGLVDEVVIYDTGSTDGSIELARKAGAKVIEGFWDDDFGRARNVALENCTGDWVLHIDADERFEGNATKIRALVTQANVTAFAVEILNLTEGDKHNTTHRPGRLFRRDTWMWNGRLHEQILRRDGSPKNELAILEGGRILHYGYMASVIEAKGKAERNIRIASLDAENAEGRDQADVLSNLGRSYMIAGRYEDALGMFVQARALQSEHNVINRTFLRSGIQTLFALNRPAEALDWIEDFEKWSKATGSVRYFRGVAYANDSQWDKAIEQLAGLSVIDDDDGIDQPLWVAQVKLAAAYAANSEWVKAADAITPAAMHPEMHDEAIWALVVDVYSQANRELGPLFAKIPAHHMDEIFGQLNSATPEAVDKALEALWSFEDRRNNVLALAIRTAPYLGIERMIEWSQRIRAVGLEQHCPLVTTAWEPLADPVVRTQAAVILHAAVNDPSAIASLKNIAASTPIDKFSDCLVQVSELDPSLLETFVVAAATNAQRSLAMGQVLFAFGADEEGIAVAISGLETNSDTTVAEDAATWLESIGRTDAAQLARTSKQ